MIKLVRTCAAFPEQYDAFDGARRVGYLRLRHGAFIVECPDTPGELVYCASPKGDGSFEEDERDYYLRFAVHAIEQWTRGVRPPAPDVQYEVVE
jgi:hypothetical protein